MLYIFFFYCFGIFVWKECRIYFFIIIHFISYKLVDAAYQKSDLLQFIVIFAGDIVNVFLSISVLVFSYFSTAKGNSRKKETFTNRITDIAVL